MLTQPLRASSESWRCWEGAYLQIADAWLHVQVATGGDRVSWTAMDDGSAAPAKQSRRSNPVLLEREKIAALGYVLSTSSYVTPC